MVRITDAAVEAAIEEHHAQYDDLYPQTPPWLMQMLKRDLTAAYPHIRRAVIEELIGKYEAEAERNLREPVPRMFGGAPFPDISDAAGAARRLRAEMEGDDRG